MLGPQRPLHLSQAFHRLLQTALRHMTEIRLWVTYEEEIYDGCDITDISPRKMGLALRNSLEGYAAVYKSLLDRERSKQENGVQYSKSQLRHFFVKGVTFVVLWRCLRLSRFLRGGNDLMRWLGRTRVLIDRTSDSWMDLRKPVLADDPQFPVNAQRVRNQLHTKQAEQRRVFQSQNPSSQTPPKEPAPTVELMLAAWNARKREHHAG